MVRLVCPDKLKELVVSVLLGLSYAPVVLETNEKLLGNVSVKVSHVAIHDPILEITII